MISSTACPMYTGLRSLAPQRAVSLAGFGHAPRTDKRFAMAGITNVWPLSPEDWSTG